MSEKLQKVLARAGLGSRRALEEWISQGRVSVNGSVVKLGERVTAEDVIRVDGRVVQVRSEEETPRRVLMYYKPEGEVCSRHDPEGRTSVFDRLPSLHGMRWISVGRLDINTAGLLLFTTDGELAHRLMHPSAEVEREYAARIFGEVTDENLKAVTQGVMLEDGMCKFARVLDGGGEGINHWYHCIVREGKYRMVRRLWESQDLQVSRLIRIRYGSIVLPSTLKTGMFQDLDEDQVNSLTDLVEMKGKRHTGLYRTNTRGKGSPAKKRIKSGGGRRGHLRGNK